MVSQRFLKKNPPVSSLLLAIPVFALPLRTSGFFTVPSVLEIGTGANHCVCVILPCGMEIASTR
jgi:hypothetical protein